MIECFVPPLRLLPPGRDACPFEVTDPHVGIDTVDVVTQHLVSHHLTREDDGRYRRTASRHRYAWPAELGLMARLAGLTLAGQDADWSGTPFTADSPSHVSVWRRASA